MTLNVVLKAKGDHAIDRDGAAITCAGDRAPLAGGSAIRR